MFCFVLQRTPTNENNSGTEWQGIQQLSSELGSVILCGTFRRISQLWDDALTLNLENCLLYLLSTISQFFGFVHCIVFDFIFYCVTAHTLYFVRNISTNISALGQRTDLKLGELSSLVIVYNITIFWLCLLYGF